MSSAGTLLSDLDSRGSSESKDNDLVQKILADMNDGGGGSGGGGNSVQMPSRGMSAPPPPMPAMGSPGVPQGMSTFQQAADPMMAQAHMIGRDHPTPGDFAHAIHGMAAPRQEQQWAGGQEDSYEEPKKNWYARILDDLKTPLVVALIFFVLSLPAVNLLVSHYFPALVLPTGNLSTVGLAAKSLVAGVAYWVLFRIVAPLLKS